VDGACPLEGSPGLIHGEGTTGSGPMPLGGMGVKVGVGVGEGVTEGVTVTPGVAVGVGRGVGSVGGRGVLGGLHSGLRFCQSGSLSPCITTKPAGYDWP
jgi:hypothetical protein